MFTGISFQGIILFCIHGLLFGLTIIVGAGLGTLLPHVRLSPATGLLWFGMLFLVQILVSSSHVSMFESRRRGMESEQDADCLGNGLHQPEAPIQSAPTNLQVHDSDERLPPLRPTSKRHVSSERTVVRNVERPLPR